MNSKHDKEPQTHEERGANVDDVEAGSKKSQPPKLRQNPVGDQEARTNVVDMGPESRDDSAPNQHQEHDTQPESNGTKADSKTKNRKGTAFKRESGNRRDVSINVSGTDSGSTAPNLLREQIKEQDVESEPDLESEPTQKPAVKRTANIIKVNAVEPDTDVNENNDQPQQTKDQVSETKAREETTQQKADSKTSKPVKQGKKANGDTRQRIFKKPSSRESNRTSTPSEMPGDMEDEDLLLDEDELNKSGERMETVQSGEKRPVAPLYKSKTDLPPNSVRSQPTEKMTKIHNQDAPVQETGPVAIHQGDTEDHEAEVSEVYMRNYLLANVSNVDKPTDYQTPTGGDFQAWHNRPLQEEGAEGASPPSTGSTIRQPSNRSTADSSSSYIKENDENDKKLVRMSRGATSIGPRASGRGNSKVVPSSKIYNTQVSLGTLASRLLCAALEHRLANNRDTAIQLLKIQIDIFRIEYDAFLLPC